jgi:signal transduction histidine kinase
VLINLAANATKFTDEGSVTIRVDARVNALRFEVEDTGIGMTEEQLESAFDAFAQPHSPHARGVSGTGLGLTISRALVEQMGGRLSATSTVGEGTTFWFELPVEAPAE